MDFYNNKCFQINGKEDIKKLSNKIFIINFIIVFLAYGLLTKMHFSSDTYFLIYNDASNQALRLGRIVNFAVYKFLNYLNINVALHQAYFTVLFLVIITLSITYLVIQICYYFNKLTYIKVISVNLAILITFINVYFLEWLLFPEASLNFTMSLASIILSIYFIFNNKFKRNVLLAFIFLVISMNTYQINISYYIIFSLTIILIKNEIEFTKSTIKELFLVLAIGLVAGVLNIFSLEIIKNLGFVSGTSRDVNFNLIYLINNIKTLFIKGQYEIWIEGSGFMPKYSMILFLVISFMIMMYSTKNKKIEHKNVICVLIVCAINYLIILFPHVITTNIWLAPRTIVGIFAYITSINLISLKLEYNVKVFKLTNYVMILFLIISFTQIHDITMNHFTANKIDKEYSYLINSEIGRYEKENNVTLKNIATINDSSPTYGYYNNVNYIRYDTNLRKLVVSWADVNMINYYNGKNYNKVEMDNKIYDIYFKDKNWDYFNPSEQMVFVDDTLYMIMY